MGDEPPYPDSRRSKTDQNCAGRVFLHYKRIPGVKKARKRRNANFEILGLRLRTSGCDTQRDTQRDTGVTPCDTKSGTARCRKF